ncbi:MAG: hypothetical protein OXC71_08970 [Chloroflexi bacterium]|nr:hypothetical protein [Chloroflexota bacterium]
MTTEPVTAAERSAIRAEVEREKRRIGERARRDDNIWWVKYLVLVTLGGLLLGVAVFFGLLYAFDSGRAPAWPAANAEALATAEVDAKLEANAEALAALDVKLDEQLGANAEALAALEVKLDELAAQLEELLRLSDPLTR